MIDITPGKCYAMPMAPGLRTGYADVNEDMPNLGWITNRARETASLFDAEVRGRIRAALRCAGWLALAFILCLSTGCATGSAPSTQSFPPPPSEEVRAQLNSIRVVSAFAGVRPEFAKPDTKGQAAGKGALAGMAVVGQTIGQGGGSGIAILVEIAALPIGAAVGAISGSLHGTSKAEVVAAEKTLSRVFSEMDFQMAIRREVVEAGRKNTRHVFVTADEVVPALPDGAQTDAILEVTVLSAGLAGKGEKGAPLSVFLRVQVRLLDSPAKPPLYSNIWAQTSGARPFREWAADDGRAFREELANASRKVAESIIEELFLAYRPPKT